MPIDKQHFENIVFSKFIAQNHHPLSIIVMSTNIPHCLFLFIFAKTFLSLELVSGLSFVNQTSYDLAVSQNDAPYQDLAQDFSSTCLTYI